MEPVEPDCQRYLQRAAHGGLDIVERDLEVGDAGGRHAARLQASGCRFQFQASNHRLDRPDDPQSVPSRRPSVDQQNA